MDCQVNASIDSLEYTIKKYGKQGLLASSADLGWPGISAELRTHDRGVFVWQSAPTETVVCVATSASNSLVTRFTAGAVDHALAERGRIWLCPPGVRVDLLDLSAPVEILHIYLPSQHFSVNSLGIDAGRAVQGSLRHEYSFRDPLVAEIAFAIAAELRAQTAGGRLLAETLAGTLAARLIHRHAGSLPDRHLVRPLRQGLDRRRLTRVKEYIAANLEGDLTIARLAKVASLSRFHFARAFKTAVGQAPHQYVSAHRLERAKELLIGGEQSLLDIAIALNFSSQANFTRAFHRSTGMTPGQYRRDFTHSQARSARTANRSSQIADTAEYPGAVG